MISDRPRVLTVDVENRPHGENGPFCQWSDGTRLYAWHGTRVPSDVIERPETLTKARILGEQNAEIRRVMIERVGNERFLSMVEAQPVHEDQRGKLYRIEIPGDETMTLVQVVNSTPEPDGHSKIYTLRVPPTIQRASEGVAWSFGLTEADYAPAQET